MNLGGLKETAVPRGLLEPLFNLSPYPLPLTCSLAPSPVSGDAPTWSSPRIALRATNPGGALWRQGAERERPEARGPRPD